MMKNISIPITEITARQARAAEIIRLTALETISADAKAGQLQNAQAELDAAALLYKGKRDALRADYAAQINALPPDQTSEELIQARDIEIDTINAQHDAFIAPVIERQKQIMAIVTNEERAEQLIALNQADELSQASYGIQPMSVIELSIHQADEQKHAGMVYEQQLNQYKDARRAAYPTIGDQLDALWKGGADADAMAAQIAAVKAQYPKPETPPEGEQQPGEPGLQRVP